MRPVTLEKGRIGLISDTHGLLRPEAVRALRAAELILHAGDIGAFLVLEDLRSLSRVVAIRGNNDRGGWACDIPETAEIQINGMRCLLIHDLHDVDDVSNFDVVISGHSHKPKIEKRQGALFINPGSAGPRRFKLPVTIGRMHIKSGKIAARIVELL